ncbi:putative inositol 5-phosphatase [Ilyonectria robusta]|uniref:putative inositol 5-phosphatase n=1 Tax=Ilyonectria robusta TaxID=1079257 RepID=UPI001E8D6E51|nr:putative inositol 5-phosphatase [Ilyonectria robusta]KAH8729642.1 putative inositol 5-phosphatase [Ilyonectria robusta]
MSSSSVLDLLVLTFNCGKSLVDAPVFAHHLQTALSQNASGLPDLVVLSLQEIAPLSYCFIGGYFLNPYLTRFEEAVNIAAQNHGDAHPAQGDSLTQPAGPARPYTLVRANNVGYTGIMLFARDPSRLQDIQEAEVGFGAAEMGNKGAVGLRMLYEGGSGESTEVTFVSTHLAAMEWNLPRRNANWAAIMRGMAFENPEAVVANFRASSTPSTPSVDETDEQVGLLHDEHDAQQSRLQQQLHNISVFRPSSNLFVSGDLNYRISTTSPPPAAAFPSLDPESVHYYPEFFRLDQLTRERKAGRTLHGLEEHEVRFPPTYKYDVLPPKAGADEGLELDVPWKFATHRYPSWTDRILFLDIPFWAKGKSTANGGGESQEPNLKVRAYDALPLLRSSDHRPVFLRVEVPLIAPKDLAPPLNLAEVNRAAVADPRVRLPVEIDPEAWERRAAARRKEVMAGWSMFLWSTKQGAWILATLLIVGLSAYGLYGSF